jgi:hypothetical protein
MRWSMKTIDQFFVDWESQVFGYGYGTGETHVLRALKEFFAAVPVSGTYDYDKLEQACTPTVAWLLLNTLGHANVIDYGTSSRFGWLTPNGAHLAGYIRTRTLEHLLTVIGKVGEEYVHCFPDYCNCVGEKDAGCCKTNPFWYRRQD